MGSVVVVESTPEHAIHIAQNMRQVDRHEVYLWSLKRPAECMLDALKKSDVCLTGLWDDEPGCMFGVTELKNATMDCGIIWMLGTDAVDKNQLAFIKAAKEHVPAMASRHKLVQNYVWAENKKSIRWLKFMGFDFDPAPIPCGFFQAPFWRFTMESK